MNAIKPRFMTTTPLKKTEQASILAKGESLLSENKSNLNKRENIMTTTSTNNSNMTKERYLQIKANFKAFVKDPENRPYYCETYGTKYEGYTSLIHFALYAILRNKDPKITSHDPENSEKFLDAISDLKSIYMTTGNIGDHRKYIYVTKPFGLTSEELKEALSVYFQ